MRTGFVFLLMVIALLVTLSLQGQPGGNTLYLLSGAPSPKSAATYPAVLYSLDRAKGALQSLRIVAPANDGTEFITAWPDYRVVVVASPHVRPTHFEIVHMDAPLAPYAFDIDPGSMSFISAALLDVPERGLFQAIYLANGDRTRALGANLSVPGASLAVQEIAPEDFRYARFGGLYGGAQGGRDSASARLRGDQLESWLAGRWVNLASAPPDMQLAAGQEASVAAATKDVTAVLQPTPGKDGASRVAVYNRGRQQWLTLRVPGSRAWIRGFGPWLAVSVAEPLNGRRNPGYGLRRNAATRTGPAVEAQFEQSGLYFPGHLLLYDSRTGRSVTVDTGQADSEILAVDETGVLYRVNNALLESSFSNGALAPPVRLLEDQLLTDVHWAFFGPDGR